MLSDDNGWCLTVFPGVWLCLLVGVGVSWWYLMVFVSLCGVVVVVVNSPPLNVVEE